MKGLSSAVGFAAKLKPEIRLAQAISEFNASLSNKNQRARFKNLQSQSPPSSDDIIRLTEEINRDGAREHRSWRPYGTRLVAILERMRQFAPIGDVMVGGSQNLIACGVWAVVRLSLEASLSFLSYFENVTSMMLRLGQSLSLHKDFAMLFPSCPKLQSYMCEYTIVMVNICAKIVHDCAKSTLSQLAASFTSTFDAIFRPLELDLATWAQSIEKRATVLLAKADLQSQSSALEQFNRLQASVVRGSTTQQKETRKHQLFTALFPDQGEFNLIWRRERKRGTSSWMYEEDAYKSWLSSKVGSVLWLKGNLGSGKTVTMASAVAHLTLTAPSMDPQGAVTVSYFFCQSKNPKTLSACVLLGSIVGQALRNPLLEPSLMSFLEQLDTIPDTRGMPEDYIDILLKATPPDWRGIFVLDGLDEMPQEEVDDIFGQLHRLGKHRWLSLLCSSRPTSVCYTMARSKLDEMWTLSMEAADRSEEIRAYLAAEISRWNAIRPLTVELNRLVEEQLLAGCQGMLLWLSLQIEDICPRYTQELRSDAEILDILGNLPKDLPGAFDKALSRMRDGKYGSKLFKLVASAEPPLSMDELRVASNVEPGNTFWDGSTLASSGKALVSAYGGSLLDIDEEDLRVRFIHYSVLLHLTAPSSDAKTDAFHFELQEAEKTLGAVCVTYLNYGVFENRVSTAQKVSFGRMPQAMAESVMPSETSRKAFSLLAKHRRRRDPKVDLERLSYELQSEKWRVRDDVHLFLDYAQRNWLSSTRHTWSDDQYGLPHLWRNLMTHPIVSASLPWESISEGADWALRSGHATLFQYFLHSDDQDQSQVALSAIVQAASFKIPICISGEGLGRVGPLYLMNPNYQAHIMQALIDLGCRPFGAIGAKILNLDHLELSLAIRATAYLAAALGSYSDDQATKQYILFLANYSTGDDLVLLTMKHVRFLVDYSTGYDLVLDDESTMKHVRFLARYVTDYNIDMDSDRTILDIAVHYGCNSLAEFLLSKSTYLNRGYLTPLQLSIDRRFVGLTLELIKRGEDATGNPDGGLPPLFLAIDKANLAIFLSLLPLCVDALEKCHGPQEEAVYHHLCRWAFRIPTKFAEAALLALINYGAKVNSISPAGETCMTLLGLGAKEGLKRILRQYGQM